MQQTHDSAFTLLSFQMLLHERILISAVGECTLFLFILFSYFEMLPGIHDVMY